MRWKSMTIGIVTAVLAIAPAAQAADWTVTGTDPDDAPGSCTAQQCTNIRAALTAISAGDTVTLQPGNYQLASALVLDKAVTLRGGTARNTTLTAAPQARVLMISADASISHLTITNGTASGDVGGNISATGASVSLDQVRVTNGQAGTGAGIANRSGTMTITNSLIDGNTATATGGGIANGDGTMLGAASLTVRNATVTGNTAAQGGGIASLGDLTNALALQNVTVAANHTSGGGAGGISVAAGTFSMGSSIVAGNTRVPGGETANCGGTKANSDGWNVETTDECLNRQEPDQVVADAGLRSDLDNLGGETDVLAPLVDSPAVNVKAAGDCLPTDQTGVTRPQGPACDAGAVELAYAVRIDSGPTGAATSPQFTFSATSPTATFECALDTATAGTFAPCTSPLTLTGLANGAYTLRVRSLEGTNSTGEDHRDFTVDAGTPVVIQSGPEGPIHGPSATFTFTLPGDTDCRLFTPGTSDPTYAPCASPQTYDGLTTEGAYRFEVSPAGNHDPALTATREFSIDTTAPAAPAIAAPGEDSVVGSSFVLSGTVPDGTTTVHLFDNGTDAGTVPATTGTWQRAFSGLADGTHVFTATASDAAGNTSALSAPRTVRVETAVPTPTETAQPSPAATASPTPAPIAVATPAPTPQADETVVVRPTGGKVFVRQPGATQFVEISRSSAIPVGSEIDTRKGKIVLTAESVDGKPVERATFYAGLFIVQQVGEYIELTLSEELAPCKKKKKASAAAAKPKTRKLWGDGKGKFRTKGQYSAATVRGTQWLVQDSCDGTLTRVAQGLVSVRDIPRRKTVLLRAGRSYLAKPKQ